MHADYIANPLYDNNPFIEALPPMLSGKDLIRALAVIPPYSDSDRDRSTGERFAVVVFIIRVLPASIYDS